MFKIDCLVKSIELLWFPINTKLIQEHHAKFKLINKKIITLLFKHHSYPLRTNGQADTNCGIASRLKMKFKAF